MVASVLVELSHVFIDKTFSYNVPDLLKDNIKIGMRVTVPFGSQTLEGFVLSLKKEKEDNLKDIISLVDSYPVLNKELLSLGRYIKDETLCTLIQAYQVMLPKALKAKKKTVVPLKYEKYIYLNKDININDYKLNNTQTDIINILLKEEKVLKSKLTSISSSSVKTLLNKNIILEEEKEVYRLNIKNDKTLNFSLSLKQDEIYKEIKKGFNTNTTYLLHGITGSGKTNIYIKLIEDVIKQGKTAIFLVPEISLTPQIIDKFTSFFDDVAVFHSGLSDGEKYDEYRKIREGKVNIVVGARSAIFTPFENIGIIIIDEEHSSTYKQENTPRYNAISVAKERAKYHNCPLVLGSATPSLESYARAEKGVYKLLTLSERYNKMNPPKVEIIDMNKEFKSSNGYISNTLLKEIEKVLESNNQVILFLNKRGYSSLVSCISCGFTYKCPNCDITLTYHKSSNMLRCHYCGYATKKDNTCPSCHEEFKEYGMGTEKLEEEIKEKVKNAKVLRMDIDTTTRKNAHDKIIKSFMNKEYNILLGTQMIAKGLDFPSVTLVGVINADISLNFPDYRSSENTFDLLNQVSGRSGRGTDPGKVLIQTFNKDHYAIKYNINNDYVGFYKEEMGIRRKLGYPPYYYICLIKVISKDYEKASDTSINISKYLRENIKNDIVLGPSCANIFKMNNEYRFQIIIKYKNIDNIRKYVSFLNEHYFNNKKVRLEIDFNPIKF